MSRDVIIDAAAELARLEIDSVARFLDNLKSAFDDEVRRLGELITKADREYADVLGDEFSSEKEVVELGEQLAIVAAYRVVELLSKRVLAFSKYGPKKAGELFRFDRLKDALRKDFGVDISTLDGFAGVNEIRLINNAVKHDGLVSHALAEAYPQWKEGAELKGLREAFERLSGSPSQYVRALAAAVIP
jgi:hypothetical protein